MGEGGVIDGGGGGGGEGEERGRVGEPQRQGER